MAPSNTERNSDTSIQVQIPIALVERLLNERALVASDVRCLNHNSKAELKRMLLNRL